MKQLLFLIILAGTLLSCGPVESNEMFNSSNRDSELDIVINPKEPSEVRTFDLTNYHSIEAGSFFTINVIVDGKESVVAIMDSTAMKYFNPRVKNGVLHIEWDPSIRSIAFQDTMKVKIDIHVKPSLKSVDFSGSTRVNFSGVLLSENLSVRIGGASQLTNLACSGGVLNLDVRGSGSCEAEANVHQLKLDQSGASHVKMNTNTQAADIEISGSSKLYGQFMADQMNFKSSGASVCSESQWIVNKDLTLDLSGASKFEASGRANTVTIQSSGASNCNAKDFVTPKLDVSGSGSSQISMTVNESIKGSLSGASNLNYLGQAVSSVSTSGAAQVHRLDR